MTGNNHHSESTQSATTPDLGHNTQSQVSPLNCLECPNMGTKNSRKLENTVLDDEDINDPLFKELHLVILGCHDSGKNAIVNAIFRNKGFTFSTSFENHVERKGTVFGTKVTIVRAPGWSGELTLQQKHRELRQEIKDAVSSFEKGPHAIILAIKDNSTPTEITQATLEKLLTRRFWDHTIIISNRDPEKANNENIKSLIEYLNQRYCVLQKPTGFDESKKLIRDIALMIAEKENVPLRFSVIESEYDESHEKNNLIKSLRRKIQKLRKHDRNSITERIKTNTERERLQNILQIHEGPRINSALPDQSTFDARKTEDEDRTSEAAAEIHLTKASKLLSLTEMTFENSRKIQDAIELNGIFQCDFHAPIFNEGDLYGWYGCLVKILEDLTEEQFKKKKNRICNLKDDRIPKGRVENQNRNTLAEVMIETWGEKKCIIYTRDILKDIPRNDEKIINLILPFLQSIGESW